MTCALSAVSRKAGGRGTPVRHWCGAGCSDSRRRADRFWLDQRGGKKCCFKVLPLIPNHAKAFSHAATASLGSRTGAGLNTMDVACGPATPDNLLLSGPQPASHSREVLGRTRFEPPRTDL